MWSCNTLEKFHVILQCPCAHIEQGLNSARLVGTITVEELHEALKKSAAKLPVSEIQGLMENVDMNESGAIDYEEFLAATLHASKVASDEHLRRAFQEFDHDGSGKQNSPFQAGRLRWVCLPNAWYG
jgi:di/tripeptidase